MKKLEKMLALTLNLNKQKKVMIENEKDVHLNKKKNLITKEIQDVRGNPYRRNKNYGSSKKVTFLLCSAFSR